MRYQAFKHLMG